MVSPIRTVRIHDFLTKTVVQEGQVYALRELLLTVFPSRYVVWGIFSSLKEYNKQRKAVWSTIEAERTVQRVFACYEFGFNKAL